MLADVPLQAHSPVYSVKRRHKILHALFEKTDQMLEGSVESDETYVEGHEPVHSCTKKPMKTNGSALYKLGANFAV